MSSFITVDVSKVRAAITESVWLDMESGALDQAKALSHTRLLRALVDAGVPPLQVDRVPLRPWEFDRHFRAWVLRPAVDEVRVPVIEDPRPTGNPVDRKAWLLGIAQAVAAAADCSRRQVGALIVDPRTWHILSTGYNGRPRGLPGCASAGACPRAASEVPSYTEGNHNYLTGPGRCDADHAEDNALRRAREHGIEVGDAWVVVTCEPCNGCYALLRHYGIAKVVWTDGERDL